MGSVSDIAASAGPAGTGSEPPDAAGEPRPPAFQLAPRMAKALLIGVFGGFYAIAFVRIVLASKGTEASTIRTNAIA